MKPFWPRQERLEWELQALNSSGYSYKILSGDPAQLEQLLLKVSIKYEDKELQLKVFFPELYPFFRFQIAAPDLDLDHHQNPLQHWLCVLGRGTDQWRLRDNLAEFLDERVPRAISAGAEKDRAVVEGIEEEQAEPFSDYYPYEQGHLLIIDGEWEIDPEVDSGRLVLGIQEEPLTLPLRAVVREVQDDKEQTLAAMDAGLAEAYPYTRYARWIRVGDPIAESDPSHFYKAVSRKNEIARKQPLMPFDGGNLRLTAVLFDEEHSWRDEFGGTGWVAIAREQSRLNKKSPKRKDYFVRVARAGRQDFALRIPELQHMSKHDIAVVGLGCLGAPVALEFARMGARKLCLIDFDFVDPATTVRWPLGRPVYGKQKVEALREHIKENYPRTKVQENFDFKLGAIRPPLPYAPSAESGLIEEALANASIIVDATAEHGVQRFLSEYARNAETPFVWIEGRQGAWGGVVGRYTPGGACWGCIEMAMFEGEVQRPPSAPDEGGLLQPQGCGDPTFTGAAFDMQMVAMSGVRMSVTALSERSDAYPARSWNLEVISLRDSHGNAIAPRWDTYSIERNPSCSFCGE